jgi:hypothetical protein
MTGFQGRLAAAHAHEDRVRASLLLRGWAAEPFGQGQLTPEMRDYLRRVPTSVRWMPDIIAAKQFAARTQVVFVDAKAGDRYKDTGNHDIELAALDAAEKWIQLAGDACPYYFVFDDGGVLTPSVARELGDPGVWRGNGSGTPFLLVPSIACQSFDGVFGPREPFETEAA